MIGSLAPTPLCSNKFPLVGGKWGRGVCGRFPSQLLRPMTGEELHVVGWEERIEPWLDTKLHRRTFGMGHFKSTANGALQW